MGAYYYRWTERRIARLIKEGRGRGFGAAYVPWLKVDEVPSIGRSSRLTSVCVGRLHHVMSDNERAFLLDQDWSSDTVDLREQFPLDREERRADACRST